MARHSHLLYGGGLNGLYQIIGEILMPVRTRIVRLLHVNTDSLGARLIRAIVTFVLVDFAWIFFRANHMHEAVVVIKQIVTNHDPGALFTEAIYECGLDSRNFRFMIFAIAVLFVTDLMKRRGIVIRDIIAKQDIWCKCAFVALSVLFILTFGKYGPAYDAANFIYFQF